MCSSRDLFTFAFMALAFAFVSADYGQVAFEKMTELDYRGNTYYTIRNLSLYECQGWCREEPDCIAASFSFVVNPLTPVQETVCQLQNETSAQNPSATPKRAVSLYYMVKLKVRSDNVCKRPWTFERVPNKIIVGLDRASIFTSTKEACLAACLNEPRFVCRSVEYNYVTLQCHLSEHDRRSVDEYVDFADAQGIDYFENLCLSSEQACRGDSSAQVRREFQVPLLDTPEPFVAYHVDTHFYVDKELMASNQPACERACVVESEFLCRSFLYKGPPSGNTYNCQLFHLDHVTLPDGALTFRSQDRPLIDEGRPYGTYFENRCQKPKSHLICTRKMTRDRKYLAEITCFEKPVGRNDFPKIPGSDERESELPNFLQPLARRGLSGPEEVIVNREDVKDLTEEPRASGGQDESVAIPPEDVVGLSKTSREVSGGSPDASQEVKSSREALPAPSPAASPSPTPSAQVGASPHAGYGHRPEKTGLLGGYSVSPSPYSKSPLNHVGYDPDSPNLDDVNCDASGTCYDVSVHCKDTRIVVQTRTNKPFNGRVYALGRSETCNIDVADSDIFRLDLTMAGQDCNTQSVGGVYTNTIVIQHHNVVMTKSDKIYKIRCTYDMSSRNITFGMMPIKDPEMLTVTAAPEAPAPKIRILDSKRQEVDTVRIGDRLNFVIEIPENTPYGIFVKNCIAMAKDARSTFQLTDDKGCPVDREIFPQFSNEGNAMVAAYDAFRFTESYGVIFQCNVKYCLGRCQPALCEWNRDSFESWGKRRRRSASVDNDLRSDNMMLSQELMVLDFNDDARHPSDSASHRGRQDEAKYQHSNRAKDQSANYKFEEERLTFFQNCPTRTSVLALAVTCALLLLIYLCSLFYLLMRRWYVHNKVMH